MRNKNKNRISSASALICDAIIDLACYAEMTRREVGGDVSEYKKNLAETFNENVHLYEQEIFQEIGKLWNYGNIDEIVETQSLKQYMNVVEETSFVEFVSMGLIGVAGGAAIGAVIGSFLLPGLGTIFGIAGGAVWGAGEGALCGALGCFKESETLRISANGNLMQIFYTRLTDFTCEIQRRNKTVRENQLIQLEADYSDTAAYERLSPENLDALLNFGRENRISTLTTTKQNSDNQEKRKELHSILKRQLDQMFLRMTSPPKKYEVERSSPCRSPRSAKKTNLK